MVQAVLRTMVFPSCSSLTRCSTSRCAGPADSSGAVFEKSVEIPQLQLVVFLLGHCRSHARRCATTNAWWFRAQKTAKVSQLQCSDTVSGFFWGPVHRYRAGSGPHN